MDERKQEPAGAAGVVPSAEDICKAVLDALPSSTWTAFSATHRRFAVEAVEALLAQHRPAQGPAWDNLIDAAFAERVMCDQNGQLPGQVSRKTVDGFRAVLVKHLSTLAIGLGQPPEPKAAGVVSPHVVCTLAEGVITIRGASGEQMNSMHLRNVSANSERALELEDDLRAMRQRAEAAESALAVERETVERLRREVGTVQSCFDSHDVSLKACTTRAEAAEAKLHDVSALPDILRARLAANPANNISAEAAVRSIADEIEHVLRIARIQAQPSAEPKPAAIPAPGLVTALKAMHRALQAAPHGAYYFDYGTPEAHELTKAIAALDNPPAGKAR